MSCTSLTTRTRRISTQGFVAGGKVGENLNNLQVPWIWSSIRFDSESARFGSVHLPDHEIFPNYFIYYNGVKIKDTGISRSILEQFISLGENK